MNDEKYTKRFYSEKSFESFLKKIHPNRIISLNRSSFKVQYLRNTKKNRIKYDFPDCG